VRQQRAQLVFEKLLRPVRDPLVVELFAEIRIVQVADRAAQRLDVVTHPLQVDELVLQLVDQLVQRLGTGQVHRPLLDGLPAIHGRLWHRRASAQCGAREQRHALHRARTQFGGDVEAGRDVARHLPSAFYDVAYRVTVDRDGRQLTAESPRFS